MNFENLELRETKDVKKYFKNIKIQKKRMSTENEYVQTKKEKY